MAEPEAVDAGTLRWIAALAFVTCAIAMVLGACPGVELYRNAKLVKIEPAGGVPLVVMMLPVLIGAFAIWRTPRQLAAWLWAVVTIVLCVIGAVIAVHFEVFGAYDTVTLPAADAVAVLLVILAIMAGIIAVLVPVSAIQRWRAARPEPLAKARVVQRRTQM